MNINSKEFYWSVGERIRDFRQRKQYTVGELAEKVGISTKYMYQIENGKVSFSTEILYNIANSLGVSTDAILGEEELDVACTILSQVSGKFTVEEKAYIKRAIIDDIINKSDF